MTLLCWGFNSHAKSQNLNQGYGYMKIFKTEQRKLKFDKGGYWPKSIIPNLLSVKEQPKNQESEVHMGKHWKSFLGAVKHRQKHVNTRRRFIYYSISGKNPERQKLRGSATFGAATERGVSVCTACSATGWGSPLLILDIRWCRWCFCSARLRTLLLWTLPANTTAHKVNDWSARLRSEDDLRCCVRHQDKIKKQY